MASTQDYRQLISKSRQGDQESLKQLCEVATVYLRSYVYRLTLRHDVTQDIAQEAVLEMVKFLEKLESTEKFRPWLRTIADNKLYHRQKQAERNKTVPLSPGLSSQLHGTGDEGLAHLVSDELRQIVLESMAALNPLHRKVLILRCYENLKYSDIAEEMGRSEFAVRMMFTRAKRALAKNLSHRGLAKGSLLTALLVFGWLTAESKAAAPTVTVAASTLKTGLAAGALTALTSKAGLVTLTAAGVLGAAAVVATSGPEGAGTISHDVEAAAGKIAPAAALTSGGIDECWHYFPEGAGGPVMMRAVKSSSKSGRSYCTWLQNEQANYRFDKLRTPCIENARMWRSDLSVWRLPTDKPQLTQFLSQVEGCGEELGYTPLRGKGLLIVARSQGQENGSDLLVVRRSHVLEKEYFQHFLPSGGRAVDNRDAMHKRGWTYFKITGEINGEIVTGAGRMPFVYRTAEECWPWLRLEVGNRLRIVDDGTQAVIYDGRGGSVARYADGSFFQGLPRPWMGLHTIDTVRRDAAQQQIRFETKFGEGEEKAKVTLNCKQGELVYTIGMKTDVVDAITISTADGKGGELWFSYLQDIDTVGVEFAEPPMSSRYGGERETGPGLLWLFRMVKDY